MSSNRETVQQIYDAIARGDMPTALGAMSPQVEWREPEGMPFEDQVGPEAVAQNIFAALPGLLPDFTFEIFEIIDAGDAVITLGKYRGTGSQTGKRLDADFVHVWRLGSDGKVTFFRTYTDTHLWREVLGTDQEATVPAQASAAEAPSKVV